MSETVLIGEDYFRKVPVSSDEILVLDPYLKNAEEIESENPKLLPRLIGVIWFNGIGGRFVSNVELSDDEEMWLFMILGVFVGSEWERRSYLNDDDVVMDGNKLNCRPYLSIDEHGGYEMLHVHGEEPWLLPRIKVEPHEILDVWGEPHVGGVFAFAVVKSLR